MEHFLQQLAAIPEVAELIRRVDGGGCPAAVTRAAAGAEGLRGRGGGTGFQAERGLCLRR